MTPNRCLLILTLSAGVALAQESAAEHRNPDDRAHAEEKSNPNEIYWKWANFAILVGVVGYLAQKNLGGYFAGRSAEIQKGIAEATAIRADAEERAASMERRMNNLEEELDRLQHEARAEMKKEADRLEQETVQLQAKIHKQAEQEIASMMNLAKQELKAYSADLALNLAEEEIRRRLNPQVQGQLVRRFGTELNRLQRVQ